MVDFKRPYGRGTQPSGDQKKIVLRRPQHLGFVQQFTQQIPTFTRWKNKAAELFRKDFTPSVPLKRDTNSLYARRINWFCHTYNNIIEKMAGSRPLPEPRYVATQPVHTLTFTRGWLNPTDPNYTYTERCLVDDPALLPADNVIESHVPGINAIGPFEMPGTAEYFPAVAEGKVKKPFWHRGVFPKIAYWGRRAAFLGAAGLTFQLIDLANRNYHEKYGYVAQQKEKLERILQSPEINKQMQAFRDRIMWTINYSSKDLFGAHETLPEVAAVEKERNLPYWSFKVQPVTPVDYRPSKVGEGIRNLISLLQERGMNFPEKMPKGRDYMMELFQNMYFNYIGQRMQEEDAARKTKYENINLHMLPPNKVEEVISQYSQDVAYFKARHLELDVTGFNRIPELREIILRRFAAHFGQNTTMNDVQRMAIVYNSPLGNAAMKDVQREYEKSRRAKQQDYRLQTSDISLKK